MNNIKYLRIILTQRCNLKCFFCHKEGNTGINSKEMNPEMLHLCEDALIRCGIKKIKFMGGEPTLYVGIEKEIERLKSIDPTLDVSMITNGVFDKEVIDKCIESGIDRINVSIHGLDKKMFKEVTKGTDSQLKSTLDNIDYLASKNILGKINYVILKNVNENEFFQVLDLIHKKNITLDILNYLDDNSDNIRKFYYYFDEIKQMISDRYQIEKEQEYVNNFSINSKRLYLKDGGVINLKVNELKNFNFLKSCKNCSKKEYCKEGIAAIRLTEKGLIKPCLFRDDNTFDLLGYLKTHSFEDSCIALNNYLEDL